jgi:predicted Zn-dependent protease
MGHEVAHALLNHGAAYDSRYGTAAGCGSSGRGHSGEKPGNPTNTTNCLRVGSQYGALLPFSRSHESEADKVGLTLMAIAGYNPDKALDFGKGCLPKPEGLRTGTAKYPPKRCHTYS